MPKTAEIHSRHYHIEASDSASGETIATVRTYCNPAALAQLILSVESDGWAIDWDASTVAKPVDNPVDNPVTSH